ncbi:hypothetical protein BDP55DRAFT_704007 [Colletotrichum godetiae]|uniref:Heterokaryon incompatibility domain-containing protein n=1 Tax=Colletotrichum godetiae TaxID=1209918 RepID=A0AAJ0EYE2_9PEZI|nr:uncharacterized protein BDP55DRAFT_704007 [Colletotrichum godetiae]KAK1676089.1 hypothetical protein BDP55DRAFT_704007 [Colletotrichum godetiae]
MASNFIRLLRPSSRPETFATANGEGSIQIRGWVGSDKKPRKTDAICKSCSELNFEQFSNKNISHSRSALLSESWVFDLKNIISNKKKERCNFCSLLFEAICAHDPFEHPAIKNYMPQDFIGKNFRQWADGLDWRSRVPWSSHPFRRGRDVIHLDFDGEDGHGKETVQWTMDENTMQKDLILASQVAVANTAVYHAIAQSAKSDDQDTARILEAVRGVIPTVITLVKRADNKLPVGVSVQMNDASDGSGVGLFVVGVWGFGCGPKPLLSCLTTFNLRMAAPYHTQNAQKNLSYGKIITPRINVEDDCLSWMRHCLKNHDKKCRSSPRPGGVHFRLVDVEDERIVRVRSDGLNRLPKYTALSYVWGDEGKAALNFYTTNLRDLDESINVPGSPVGTTTRDAIATTKRPDDEPARRLQTKQMDKIFGHAQIVLVAAAGTHANAGLAGISMDRVPAQIASEIIPGVNVLLPVRYPQTYGKWDTRAWTLQEKLLSKRMLTTERWNGTTTLLRSPHFTEYARILEQYTSRGITDSADVLNGQNHSLYDLPERLLDLALLWQPPAIQDVHLARRAGGAFPSWSWTGWEACKANPNDHDSQTHPGVRFEEPFWVSSFDDLSLRKVVATGTKAEERHKPMILWYKVQEGISQEKVKPPSGSISTTPQVAVRGNSSAKGPVVSIPSLAPMNGNGLGLVLNNPDLAKKFIDQALEFRATNKSAAFIKYAETVPKVAEGILRAHCLVCETEVAPFVLDSTAKIRKETLWQSRADINSPLKASKEPQRSAAETRDSVLEVVKELVIKEIGIRDAVGNIVGFVIPTNSKQSVHLSSFDFILLSESQYWGNEKRVDVDGFPLYNVMMVEWDHGRKTATRVGLGSGANLENGDTCLG